MPKYSHLNLISQRYPQQNCLKVYRALRLVICGRTREVDWLSFSKLDWDLLNGMTMREGLSGLVYHAWKEGQKVSERQTKKEFDLFKLKKAERDAARQTYERIVLEKLEVMKTALSMGMDQDGLADRSSDCAPGGSRGMPRGACTRSRQHW